MTSGIVRIFLCFLPALCMHAQLCTCIYCAVSGQHRLSIGSTSYPRSNIVSGYFCAFDTSILAKHATCMLTFRMQPSRCFRFLELGQNQRVRMQGEVASYQVSTMAADTPRSSNDGAPPFATATGRAPQMPQSGSLMAAAPHGSFRSSFRSSLQSEGTSLLLIDLCQHPYVSCFTIQAGCV
jgi:hypothetical protein